MDAEGQWDTLIELLGRLEIAVRPEHLGGTGGGLCIIRGQRVFFADLDADVETRVQHAVEALATLPESDGVFLPPTLRERVDKGRG